MAKVVLNTFIDPALAVDAGCNQMLVCAGQPTSYADAAARALLTASMSAPTVGAGSPDGRQANYPAVGATVIAVSGTADHICYRNTTNGTDYIVTTCSSTALVANGSNTASVGTMTRRIAAVA